MAKFTKLYIAMYKTVNIMFSEEDINMMDREEFFQAYDEVLKKYGVEYNPTNDESKHWDNANKL